jgi:tRNA pseudouridine38-40 synthase
MARYFLELAYNGTRFQGFQKQPHTTATIQTQLEEKLRVLLRQATELVGCGRTDAGVHAKHYIAHFDAQEALPSDLVYRLNRILGEDIVIFRCFQVADTAHARFDAISRAYEYHLYFQKDPFAQEMAYYYPRAQHLNLDLMQAAAKLLLNFEDFAPFCKTKTDAKTRRCHLRRSEWQQLDAQRWVYHIQGDRFLRGMVRLIVGMCLYVGEGRMSLEQVEKALQTQTPLPQPMSVPPQGLFLTDIRYPT